MFGFARDTVQTVVRLRCFPPSLTARLGPTPPIPTCPEEKSIRESLSYTPSRNIAGLIESILRARDSDRVQRCADFKRRPVVPRITRITNSIGTIRVRSIFDDMPILGRLAKRLDTFWEMHA